MTLLTLYDLIDRRDDLLSEGRYDEADGVNYALAVLCEAGAMDEPRMREAA